MHSFKVGYGKSNITPKLGTFLAGFAKERKSSAIHDDLYARAILLDKNGELYCIVQLDLLGIDYIFIDLAFEEIKNLGIKKECFFVGTTHTHSGPRGTMQSDSGFTQGMEMVWGTFDSDLCQHLFKKIREAILLALENRLESKLKMAYGEVQGVGSNRTNKNKKGDPFLFAIEFLREDGKKVLLYRYSVHPTIMNSDNLVITADLPYGVSRLTEDDEYALTLFINGSSGDISTRFTKKESSFEEIDRLGSLLKSKIAELLVNKQTPEEMERIDVHSHKMNLAVKSLGSVDEAAKHLEFYQRQLKVAQEKGEKNLRLFESQVEGAYSNYVLTKNFQGASTIEVRIRFLRLNDLLLVFFPGELFSELSNRITEKYKENVIFCGYFGGYIGYLADENAYLDKTYESMTSPFKQGEGERFIEFVEKEINKLL